MYFYASDLSMKTLVKLFPDLKNLTPWAAKDWIIFLQNDVDEPQRSRSYPPGPRSGLYTVFFFRSVAARQQENTQTIYTMIKTKTQKNSH